MMTETDLVKLHTIDPEEIEDTLLKLQKSFGVQLDTALLQQAKTFGDICSNFEKQIPFTHTDDCTTQQAFYKIRKAISIVQGIDERMIKPESKLEDLFPRSHRRQKVKAFQRITGISIAFLSIKFSVACTIFIGFILSLFAFFFSWKIAIAGLSVFSLLGWAALKLSKELAILTVGQLTEIIAREHYSKARRQTGTVNQQEILKTIQDVFMADYGIRREDLGRAALLGWN